MTTFAPWRAGNTITADRLNATAPMAWKTWAPAWSTTTGANKSSYGDATVDCRYVQFGLMVQFSVNITFGSGTVFSTANDNWTFGLPVTAALSDEPLGYASLYTGSTRAASGLANLADSNSFWVYVQSSDVKANALPYGIIDAITPWTWAAGDNLSVVGQYQAAA